MVSEVLGTDDAVIAKRLVPPWKDVATMDFISFRVDLDSSLKLRALTLTSWPAGIRRREFKEISREAWRPANRSMNYSR